MNNDNVHNQFYYLIIITARLKFDNTYLMIISITHYLYSIHVSFRICTNGKVILKIRFYFNDYTKHYSGNLDLYCKRSYNYFYAISKP